jgi:hypothetical protein
MHQKNIRIPVLVLISAFLIVISSCSVLEDSDIEMKEVYQIKEGACGELVLKERLAQNFDLAFIKLEAAKADFFQRYCPDAPCNDIKLETHQIKVEEKTDHKFMAIWVLDKQDGTLLHSVNDVISSNGYHYNIGWCPEEPPVVPND